jgi:threonine/homoserine/homoserine lactone efflux protein
MEFFLQGWVVGFIIASPIGPVGILCIRRCVADGRLVGLLTVLGAATADAIYGVMAGLGVTAVSDVLFAHRVALRIVSGLLLLVLGAATLRAEAPTAARRTSAPPRSLAGAYLSTLVLMLANPFIIFSFLAVFAALRLHLGAIGDVAAIWLFGGIFIGSAAWWLIFSLATGWLRSRMRTGGLRFINLAAGSLICGFGVWQFAELALGR